MPASWSRSLSICSTRPRLEYIDGMSSVVLDAGRGCFLEQRSPNRQAPVFRKKAQFCWSLSVPKSTDEVEGDPGGGASSGASGLCHGCYGNVKM